MLNENDIEQAARIIKNGGLVAMPTETVYGLAANALDGKAVAKIFKAKGRPMDNPLIVHISDISQIYSLVSEFPEKAKILADKFWAGPLTIILPKSKIIPDEVSAGLDTVAVRFPSNEIARKLISLSMPLAAPSANLSGSPSPTNARHVRDDMNGRIDAIIDGGECEVGVESTVITLATDIPRLLRPGGITVEQLREAIGEVIIDDAVLNPLKSGERAASPGMKYKHYAPKAHIILLEGSDEDFIRY
ncbi:MAG: threonylcarbamoyl-AMP synthase, partial [Clostridia bacterium]|nr:threonylcarbamoyl-AMP synthase [Clostridia bacterium]